LDPEDVVAAKRNIKQPLKQGRGRGGRRPAKGGQEGMMGAREGNGQQEVQRSERMEQPHAAASQFARAAGEQFKQATRQSGWGEAAPQVMGWTGSGPAQQFENMMSQFWNMAGDGGATRYMRALAQANVEMVGLLGRRSRAYLDLPTHLARCRSPQQIVEEQAKFFQDMLHDYQVTNDRMVNCWMEAAAQPASR
jgi:hypothetical protein